MVDTSRIIGTTCLVLVLFVLCILPVQAAVLWSTSFESGTIDQSLTNDGGVGGAYNSGTWNMSIASDVAHSGSKATKLTITADGTGTDDGIRLFRMQESRTRNPYYYSAWYYLPETHNTPDGWWMLMQFKSVVTDANGNDLKNDPFWDINLFKHTDGKLYLRLFGPDHTWTDVSINPVPIGHWFQIETYYQQSTTNQGHITVWLDGVQLFDKANIVTMFPAATTRAAEWSVNNYASTLSPATTTIYVDDMTVSTTRLGPGTPTPTPFLTSTQSSSTPSLPSNSSTPSVSCPRKPEGDADCDGKIKLSDYAIWRSEFYADTTTKTADFSADGRVSLSDFELWRRHFPDPTP